MPFVEDVPLTTVSRGSMSVHGELFNTAQKKFIRIDRSANPEAFFHTVLYTCNSSIGFCRDSPFHLVGENSCQIDILDTA